MPAEGPDVISEVEQIARQLAATEDEDVRGPADQFIAEYLGKVRMIHALDGVDRMTQDDVVAVEGRLQERLQKAREQLRDRLRRLLDWATSTGRMPS